MSLFAGNAICGRYRHAIVFIALVIGLSGCGGHEKTEARQSEPPAKIQNAGKEADLAMVTLTPQAESRLGIRIAQVERRRIEETRTFGGEIVPVPGLTISVSAPLAGTLAAPPQHGVLTVGSSVKEGQPVFRLVPLVASDTTLRLEAEQEAAAAEVRFAAAQTRLNRAAQLLRDRAGSVRAHEEAQADLAVAETALKAARARLDRLKGVPLDAEGGIVIHSPRSGVIQRLHVGLAQSVAAGSVLFEVARLNPVWVRVPVYVGDIPLLAPNRTAKVHGLADAPGGATRDAKPVSAPPSANPQEATADLFFELANDRALFLPGQRVGVTLALRGGDEGLVVPWSAILHDSYGGTWVYENHAPHVFVRRRVEVRRVAGPSAVLARGPSPGTKIVAAGAAELFGTEFEAGK